MLQSVFQYLRISEETAQCVQETYHGGWKAFLPRLVSLCDYLANKVYGKELEPDVSHSVYVAEQACFHGMRNIPFKMGSLASHETVHGKTSVLGEFAFPGKIVMMMRKRTMEKEHNNNQHSDSGQSRRCKSSCEFQVVNQHGATQSSRLSTIPT